MMGPSPPSKGRQLMDMKFDVEYWEHRRLTAVADAGDMRAALLGYVEDATEFTDATTLWGVRAAIADLDEGRVPSDLDVVAIAFRNDGFEAPKGTEPNGYDSPSDYVVSAHKADQPEPANPRAEVANAVAAAYAEVERMRASGCVANCTTRSQLVAELSKLANVVDSYLRVTS